MAKAMEDYPLREFYSEIFNSYDRVNRIFTFGRDVSWRKKAVAKCLEYGPDRVLDVCTGTGDFIFELAGRATGSISLVGYDFSREMLDVAERKKLEIRKQNPGMPDIDFIEGDVGNMPFENDSFDAIGITFGIRNLVYENSKAGVHLSEMIRVLRPGGKLLILESSRPANAVWRVVNSFYLQFILPYLGGLVSGNMKAYKYLAKSSQNYYTIEQMGNILKVAGMHVIKGEPLFLGSVMLIIAEKK